MFDVVIENGVVVDGTKSAAIRADVGITGDRITAIDNLASAERRDTINAKGLTVSPGFIDVHNHSDGWMLREPNLKAKTHQGFTTEVLMADGISYAPVNSDTAHEWLYYLRALNQLSLSDYDGWETLGEYMSKLDGNNVQNSAAHVPYANVRTMACGFGVRTVDDYQIREIERLIRQGMSEGAVGVSTGMDYMDQWYADTDELAMACRVAAEFDGLYVTHVRYKKTLMPALEEAVEIGRRSGVKVHISHLKAQAPDQIEMVLEFLDRARKDVDLSFDVYPYQPGSTMLNYLVPYDAFDEGAISCPGKLTDPRIRQRFESGLKAYRLDLDHIRIAWTGSKRNSKHQGSTLAEYIQSVGKPAVDALYELLIDEGLAVLCVMDEGDDRMVHPILQHDLGMIGSDGIFAEGGHVHPRVFGTAGRVLGPCVRDLKLVTLEEAVFKLSAYAANRFGFVDRGEIAVGKFADITIFDAATVSDKATFEEPQQDCVGFQHVLVNGVPIMRDGAFVELGAQQLPGRFLRRG